MPKKTKDGNCPIPNPRGNRPGDIERLDRYIWVLELRRNGLTYEEIAKEVGYANRSSAYAAFQAILQMTLHETAEEARQLELERLNLMFNKLMPGIEKGHPRAIEAAIKIMDRRAKYLGIEFASEPDVEIKVRFENIADMMRQQIMAAQREGLPGEHE